MWRVLKHQVLKVFNSAWTQEDTQAASTSTAGATNAKFLKKEDILAAEILWPVKTVVSHSSTSSSDKTGNLFQRMFPDSKIAQNFSCGETKCSYLIIFWLAPYSHNILMTKLRQSSVKYVISFDKPLNKVLHYEQMDIIIQFWDNQENKVCSRDIDSHVFRPYHYWRLDTEFENFLIN